MSTETSLSISETLSLPSTPSVTRITPYNSFPTNFPYQLSDRYQELQKTGKPLCLGWNFFVQSPPLIGQHLNSNCIHNWVLNRLQNRHDIHKDIQEHNI